MDALGREVGWVIEKRDDNTYAVYDVLQRESEGSAVRLLSLWRSN